MVLSFDQTLSPRQEIKKLNIFAPFTRNWRNKLSQLTCVAGLTICSCIECYFKKSKWHLPADLPRIHATTPLSHNKLNGNHTAPVKFSTVLPLNFTSVLAFQFSLTATCLCFCTRLWWFPVNGTPKSRNFQPVERLFVRCHRLSFGWSWASLELHLQFPGIG